MGIRFSVITQHVAPANVGWLSTHMVKIVAVAVSPWQRKHCDLAKSHRPAESVLPCVPLSLAWSLLPRPPALLTATSTPPQPHWRPHEDRDHLGLVPGCLSGAQNSLWLGLHEYLSDGGTSTSPELGCELEVRMYSGSPDGWQVRPESCSGRCVS